jgi:hypothetical protein
MQGGSRPTSPVILKTLPKDQELRAYGELLFECCSRQVRRLRHDAARADRDATARRASRR